MTDDFAALLAIEASAPYELERSSKALLTHYIETAKDRFLKDGKLIPIAVFRSEDKELVFHCGPLMGDEDDKEKLAHILRQVARDREAIAFLFVAEAWMAMYDKDQRKDDDTLTPPSERPDRIECILVSAQFKGDKTAMRILQIVRNHRGDVLHLLEKDEPKFSDDDLNYEGRFAGVLNDPKETWENTNFWR